MNSERILEVDEFSGISRPFHKIGNYRTQRRACLDRGYLSGISLANLNRIFRPMFTTKARGMGMGLSICKSIIESHNGRIWVSAGVHRGSIFQFELPIGDGTH